jgi:hypothetical protein
MIEFGSDADRYDGISHNGSSGVCGNADSAETTDLGRVLLTRARRRVRVVQKKHSRKGSL